MLKKNICRIIIGAIAVGVLSSSIEVNAFSFEKEVMNYILEENTSNELSIDKPNDFGATNITGTEITLNWKAPQITEGLTGYTLYKDGQVIAILDSKATSYTVRELRENTLYGFKIVSNYEDGKTSKPVSVNVRTEIILSKAREFGAIDITSDSLVLQWKKPEYASGLVGYTIYLNGKVYSEVNEKATSLAVSGLRSNSIYGFKIVSKYSNGKVSKPESINVRTLK